MNHPAGTLPRALDLDTVLGAPTSRELRPRYEGSNICTWIGFKHVNYLVEEAVLDHMRLGGLAPGALYERFGLCVDLVDLDTRIHTALHLDDTAVAEVAPAAEQPADGLAFTVRLAVAGGAARAGTAKVRVALRLDPARGETAPLPDAIARRAVPAVADPRGEPVAAPDVPGSLAEGRNALVWSWRIPYFYCHFTERVQLSGYLRLLEEAVDLFLAGRGVSIKTLVDEQGWIPVVPRSRVTMLAEARMEEEVHVVLSVREVFKRLTYTAGFDCYVVRDGRLLPVATGEITHGYALIENRRDWKLVDFDDRLLRALSEVDRQAVVRTGRGEPRS
ncbi:thioesterase family protein [Amycolatopsis sp. YIM 10]|uniref:acyl-CoA thioesterase n=1 Tax=Amycolatopsis sp. YIM 10 TaxID=2653857 RepID=UPI0012A818F7|nr:thioesterase family protein [Amycolatopsis sp. YIM 10]QFU90548.1 hypothetical protein YIM_26870 [Amycolatopsis sp. YIM 10]